MQKFAGVFFLALWLIGTAQAQTDSAATKTDSATVSAPRVRNPRYQADADTFFKELSTWKLNVVAPYSASMDLISFEKTLNNRFSFATGGSYYTYSRVTSGSESGDVDASVHALGFSLELKYWPLGKHPNMKGLFVGAELQAALASFDLKGVRTFNNAQSVRGETFSGTGTGTLFNEALATGYGAKLGYQWRAKNGLTLAAYVGVRQISFSRNIELDYVTTGRDPVTNAAKTWRRYENWLDRDMLLPNGGLQIGYSF